MRRRRKRDGHRCDPAGFLNAAWPHSRNHRGAGPGTSILGGAVSDVETEKEADAGPARQGAWTAGAIKKPMEKTGAGSARHLAETGPEARWLTFDGASLPRSKEAL
jgi:hypothetical protein